MLEELYALLLTLSLPRINENMTSAIVEAIHAEVETAMTLGAKLLDLRVDLSAVAPHDCPPVALYRIALRDRVWLRRLTVSPGDEVAIGAVLAHFSTEPKEPLDGEPARAARITIAGILDQSDWWRGGQP